MREVYLDYAAATPLRPEVFEAMRPFFDQAYGNPSSFHTPGKTARDKIDEARENIAKILSCRASEIIFTSGGTESDNLAILGAARANQNFGRHIIVSKIEHEAVLEPARQLEKEGFEVTYLGVDKNGLVDPKEVERALRPDTILVSIMHANNEIGTVQPIAEIGKVLNSINHKSKIVNLKFPLFHTDACQAAGALLLNVEKLHVDLMTLNAGKIYGPKGAGLLYAKRGIKLQPLQFGGRQEDARRAGTENVAGIIGLAKALELAQAECATEGVRLTALRDKLIAGLLKIPKTRLNGHPKERLPNNVNVSIMDLEGEALLLYLDAEGIYASTGSACTSALLDPSHVILALGLPPEVAHGSIRFTLGRSTTEADIDYVLEKLPPVVEKLRALSPVRVSEKYYQK